ncbi:hypothetical protein [Candidatus Sororendozoicomonas aggregata]|uniref:hypothetical protein n=1 Tax=Candidatus Sororendozoicomonas aggregata TaxID=3073239 RepID=UPI002ED5D980
MADEPKPILVTQSRLQKTKTPTTAAMAIAKRRSKASLWIMWTMPVRDWKSAMNRFEIMFPDRIKV